MPASTQSPSQPAPITSEPQAEPTTPLPTPTSPSMIPAGWSSYTSQHCEYAIGYPPDMQVSNNGTSSRTLEFKPANPDEMIPNFVYVSVIDQDILSIGEESIYNYDPVVTETLLNLQVGESQPLHDNQEIAAWYTYARLPDEMIDGNIAMTYENQQPWEFPTGTKEIRYYVSLNGCTYLIGGYLNDTDSDQPGAINEDLFNQIITTIQLMP
jgi:hypothetical protein